MTDTPILTMLTRRGGPRETPDPASVFRDFAAAVEARIAGRPGGPKVRLPAGERAGGGR